jgi:hypothetical protein
MSSMMGTWERMETAWSIVVEAASNGRPSSEEVEE